MPNVDVLHLLDRSPANMLQRATSLDDVYKTLSPEPLLTRDQVRAFYSDRLNAVRGDDKGARLALALNRAFGGNYYKAFLTYANIFKELRTHLIFTIPIALGYSQQAAQLPFSSDRLVSLPDTPVCRSDHTEHTEGREAIRSVLEARIVPGLFEEGQMMRLIVASGGKSAYLPRSGRLAGLCRLKDGADQLKPPRLIVLVLFTDVALHRFEFVAYR